MKCKKFKSDGTQCKANAVFSSDFCWYHNPDIPEEIKRSVSSKGGKANSQPEFIETPLPEIKIEKMQGLAVLLSDTINNMRTGKISQKSGSSFAYLSFILLLVLDKALKEKEKEKIDNLKAEGKWRPDPVYGVKVYTYKDDFYLDKDGKRLIVEKRGNDYEPERKNIKKPKPRKRRHRSVTSIPKNGLPLPPEKLIREVLTKKEHEKLNDEPDSHNFSNIETI